MVGARLNAKPLVPEALLAYCVAMLVTVERLTKIFGRFTAVDDVSFVVHPGEIAGLVGPNGAGKTTIIHIMLGLISPNAGTVRLFGKSLEADREQILQTIEFHDALHGISGPVDRARELEGLRQDLQGSRPAWRKSLNCWSDSGSGT